jgi:hypothetical protein
VRERGQGFRGVRLETRRRRRSVSSVRRLAHELQTRRARIALRLDLTHVCKRKMKLTMTKRTPDDELLKHFQTKITNARAE